MRPCHIRVHHLCQRDFVSDVAMSRNRLGNACELGPYSCTDAKVWREADDATRLAYTLRQTCKNARRYSRISFKIKRISFSFSLALHTPQHVLRIMKSGESNGDVIKFLLWKETLKNSTHIKYLKCSIIFLHNGFFLEEFWK